MLAPDHRQAAEDIEASVVALQSQPRSGRLAIEGCGGAAFHWIAYGCQTKHGQHHDHHARLGTFLRSLGEPMVASGWDELEHLRQGGWYGGQFGPTSAHRAQEVLEPVRTWATS